jgi:UDP-N-acetylmuramyl pentapeptide phosphotransferase/UDP-N-acetylglucosamine-1-phosphate transferase
MLTDLALGAAVSAAVSVVACRAMMAAGVVDEPDVARKAHRAPTPTSGGVGAAAGFALGMVALTLLTLWRSELDAQTFNWIAAAAGFSCGFAALGLCDDAWPLGPRLKFSLFTLGALASAWIVGIVHTLPLSDELMVALPFWVGLVGSALWVFTLVNAVNFMDGANGLAMGSVATGLIGLALVSLNADAPGAAALAFCGAAALAGFLVWNYPHGKLFAGDSGALFAGALAALASLIAIREGGVSPFIPPLLFFPLLADVLLTLAWRVSRKRRLLAGHAEHLYQIVIRGGATHAAVSARYWAVTAACAIVALIAERVGGVAPPLALACVAAASLLVSAQTRRFAQARGMGEV